MQLHTIAQHVTEFVRDHGEWAAPIVFVLAFAESLAFISLLVPAWAALVGIGALISSGGINFWPVWIAASVGAALGVCERMGHSGNLHRPLLRAVARLGAAGGRHFRDALLAFPVCKFFLGFCVGGGAAHAWRRDLAGCALAVVSKQIRRALTRRTVRTPTKHGTH